MAHAIVSEDNGSSCLACGTYFEDDDTLNAAPRCPGVQAIGPCYTDDMSEPAGHALGMIAGALECHMCGVRGDAIDLAGADDDQLARFLQGYALAMLWANTTTGEGDDRDDVDPYAWQTPGATWALDAFDPASRDSMTDDCRAFAGGAMSDVRAYVAAVAGPRERAVKLAAWESAGHDFALTRNGHGAGYWDRGLGELGERLTAWAHTFGESSAYVDSDDTVTLY